MHYVTIKHKYTESKTFHNEKEALRYITNRKHLLGEYTKEEYENGAKWIGEGCTIHYERRLDDVDRV